MVKTLYRHNYFRVTIILCFVIAGTTLLFIFSGQDKFSLQDGTRISRRRPKGGYPNEVKSTAESKVKPSEPIKFSKTDDPYDTLHDLTPFSDYSPSPLYRHRPFLPPSRIGASFAHWQILSNRIKGISRQQVLNTHGICKDLMTMEALSANAKNIGGNVSNTWEHLDYAKRLSYYGCDWYWVHPQSLLDDEARKLITVKPAPYPSRIVLDGALETVNNRSNMTAVLELALSDADLRAPHLQLLVAKVIQSQKGVVPTVLRESAKMELVGEGRVRVLSMLAQVRPLDLLLEAEWYAQKKNKTVEPMWFVPDPQELLELSPTSPMLLHVLANEMLSYQYDRYVPLPNTDDHNNNQGSFDAFLAPQSHPATITAKRKSMMHLSEVQELFDALSSNDNITDVDALVATNRRSRSIKLRHKALWDVINTFQLNRAPKQDTPLSSYPPSMLEIPSLPKPPLPLPTTGQLSVTLRNRLVRLSPSASPFFEKDLLEGMQKVGAGEANGILSQSPPHILSSHHDAIAGHWNMSDLPPWLTIPATVNVGNCLDPLNQRLELEDGKTGRYQPGEDLFEPKRSILVIGCSHARNMFKVLCSQYLHSRRMRAPPASGDAFDLDAICHSESFRLYRKDLANTFTDDDPFLSGGISKPSKATDPIALAYCQVQLEYWNDIEGCAASIYSSLMHLREEGAVSDHSFTSRTKEALALNVTKALPNFASRAFGRGRTTPDGQKDIFGYSNFGTFHGNLKAYESIKGLFSHIIFVSGPWESDQMDVTIAEHTENTAISLDLIEEYFAPREKIIMYTMHTAHMLNHDGHPIPLEPTTADALKARDITIPSYAGLPSAARNNLSAVPSKDQALGISMNDFDLFSPMSCRGPFRATLFRDAHLSAITLETRTRVRSAWKLEFETLLAKEEAASQGRAYNGSRVPTKDILVRRAPVELADFLPPTAQSLGHLFVDPAGHHYADVVLEAMSQRVLRDHVCPPQFIKATPPFLRDVNPLVTTSTSVSAQARNYALSKIPWQYPPTLPASSVSYLRVRQSSTSRSTMPSLVQTGDACEIHNLFPLIKEPLDVVSNGLRAAIFDNPKSYHGEGAVYRRISDQKEMPLWGSFNQYDPYTVSPFCACRRATRLVGINLTHPFIKPTQDEIRDGLSRTDNDVGVDLRTIRVQLGEEREDGSPSIMDPTDLERYNFSSPTFPLYCNPTMGVNPEYVIRKFLREHIHCPIEDSNHKAIRHCEGCPRGSNFVNTLEELRRRMLTFAYLCARSDDRE